MPTSEKAFTIILTASILGSSGCSRAAAPTALAAPFAVEEATITGIHQAIQSGATTCQAIVQAYIDRARASTASARV